MNKWDHGVFCLGVLIQQKLEYRGQGSELQTFNKIPQGIFIHPDMEKQCGKKILKGKCDEYFHESLTPILNVLPIILL